MLLTAALSCLLVFAGGAILARPIVFPGMTTCFEPSGVLGTTSRRILFPGPTACTAPSGVPGDCLLPGFCPPHHGAPSPLPCGIHQRKLLFCCEPEPWPPQLAITTAAPSEAAPATPALSEPALPTDCGRGGPGDGDGIAFVNIAGGRAALPGSWPWAALLGLRDGDDDSKAPQWICGGVLLGPRHVLTAAHCLAPSNDTLVVRLGEHDLSAESDARQERRVRRVVRHPDFNCSLADLALLVLDTPVKLSRGKVHPVCLPPPDAPLVGREGYVVGWGHLGFNEPQPDKLQEALVTVVKTEACERRYQRTREYTFRFPGGWRGSVLCARGREGGGIDACQGDSGGPLSVLRPDGRYHLAGLVLEGMGCGGAAFPGLYTSVPHYVDWIRRKVERL